MGGTGADEPRRTNAVLLLSVGTALGGFGGFWPTPWNYLGVGSGALMSGAGAFALENRGRWNVRRWTWRTFSRRAARPLAAVGGAVALAVSLPSLVPLAATEIRLWRYGCDTALVIRVLTSVDGYHPALEVAERYERWTSEGNRGCPSIHVHVSARSDREAIAALSVEWPDEHLERTGPRPDIWLPSSTVLVRRLHAAAAEAGRNPPLNVGRSLAFSPIVLARSAALPGPDAYRAGRSWSELGSWLEESGTGLVRADPKGSLTGELATTVLYGGTSEPRAVEQLIARSLDEGDYPLGSSAEVLCRHHERGSPATTALLVTEQDLYRYNEGHPLGGPCDGSRSAAMPGKLISYYPRDTPALDYPFVAFRWRDMSPTQLGAVEAYERWLRDEPGEQALAETGLRPAGRDAIAPLAGADGVVQSAVYLRQPIDSAVLTGALKQYEDARRGARVLLLLDASASMGVIAGGATRLTIAAGGVRSSLRRMGDTDEFGVWTYPDAGRRVVREVLPIGARDAPVNGVPRASALDAALAQVQPGGGTPLYSALVAGAQRLGASSDERIRALIVLTDGDDDNASTVSANEMLGRVAGNRVRVFAIAIGDARCAATGLAGVTAATGGRCYDATVATVERTVVELFTVLWGGNEGGQR